MASEREQAECLAWLTDYYSGIFDPIGTHDDRQSRLVRVVAINAWAAARQAAQPPLKDHEIASIVNQLRDIAIECRDAQQLRESIARVVVPALRRSI
jgi:hypothetical protein